MLEAIIEMKEAVERLNDSLDFEAQVKEWRTIYAPHADWHDTMEPESGLAFLQRELAEIDPELLTDPQAEALRREIGDRLLMRSTSASANLLRPASNADSDPAALLHPSTNSSPGR